jgi:hypothetical protein
MPRPTPVICGNWTKAIALQRVPWHLHFCIILKPRLLCGDTRMGGLLGGNLRRWYGELANLLFAARAASGMKMCSRSCGRNPSAVAAMGSGARCPRPQSPQVPNISVCLYAFARSSSFPVYAKLIRPERRVKRIFFRHRQLSRNGSQPGTPPPTPVFTSYAATPHPARCAPAR